MLTYGLEKLIQKGLAEFQTFTFGAGGVGRIPVPDGSFIIITDFDYFYFADNPPTSIIGDPAKSILTLFTDDPIAPFDVWWQFGTPFVPPGVGVAVTIDPNDLPGSTILFQNFLNTYFPGFTCALLHDNPISFLSITVTSTTPGAQFNGQIPTIKTTALGGYSISSFFGGTANQSTAEDWKAVGHHQLEFRSSKSRNHYMISENLNLFQLGQVLQAEGFPFFVNVEGVYHKDTYLVHTDDVQINILRVPVPTDWTPLAIYSPLNAESRENAIPVGYGTGAGGLPTLRRVDFSAGGLEFYYPLTDKFTKILGANNLGQSEFKVDAKLGRELSDPTVPTDAITNGKTYPVINIGYVLVNIEFNEFVKSSGG